MSLDKTTQHVCMLVKNEFLHDARVTKEAETLIAKGYSVQVIAVYNPKKNQPEEILPSGIKVSRVNSPLLKRKTIPKNSEQKITTEKNTANKKAAEPVTSSNRIKQTLDKARKIFYDMFIPLYRFAKTSYKKLKTNTTYRKVKSALSLVVTICNMGVKAYKVNADIYHAHDSNTLAVTWLAAKLRKKPFVYDAHEISTDREGYRLVRRLVWLVEKLCAPSAQFMITTTDARADFFEKNYKVARPLILQNRPRYQKISPSNYLRDYFNIPDERPILIYQGGIQRGRGLHNMLKIADQLRQCALVFVGAGAQLPSIEAEAKRLKLDGVVFFHPMMSLSTLPQATASADIGLQLLRNTCLNHYTTDSNKLFEYIMAELPVIASDFPEIRRVVTKYDVGYVVDPDNIDMIVAKIKTLLENKQMFMHFKQQARIASQAIAWEEQEQLLVEHYKTFRK